MTDTRLLKKDLFGEIRLTNHGGEAVIIRDCAAAAWPIRWLARRLLRREARALAALDGISGVPEVIRIEPDRLLRTYVDGVPMQLGKPRDPAYFRAAARLLRRLHRAGVVHNDLAKEPNLIVRPDGTPGILDFQLAWTPADRNAVFRAAAREDLRHLLKHKRTYCHEHLTNRERSILATPGLASRTWAATIKPVYLFVTRRILGWQDREGATDRGARS